MAWCFVGTKRFWWWENGVHHRDPLRLTTVGSKPLGDAVRFSNCLGLFQVSMANSVSPRQMAILVITRSNLWECPNRSKFMSHHTIGEEAVNSNPTVTYFLNQQKHWNSQKKTFCFLLVGGHWAEKKCTTCLCQDFLQLKFYGFISYFPEPLCQPVFDFVDFWGPLLFSVTRLDWRWSTTPGKNTWS